MATTHEFQKDKVFTRLPKKAVDGVLAMAAEVAAANGCTLIGSHTRMCHIPLNGRLQPVVMSVETGEQVSPMGKHGGVKLLVPCEIDRAYFDPERVFRDGTVAPMGAMTGQESQTFILNAIEGNAESAAAVKQLLNLYDSPDKSSVAWANAVAKCPDHKVLVSMKGKNPTAAQITKHAHEKVTRGEVFFPVIRDDDDDSIRLKFRNKIKQEKRKYKPATGTGFDLPIVDTYFAANPDCGLRLVSFLGRDGTEWMGKVEDIKKIHACLAVLTIYPDYHAKNIKKFTTPHNLSTLICIDVETSSGPGGQFVMPDLHHIDGLPENAAPTVPVSESAAPIACLDEGVDADTAEDTEPEDAGDDDLQEFARARKRARAN